MPRKKNVKPLAPGEERIVTFRVQEEDYTILRGVEVFLDAYTQSAAIRVALRTTHWLLEQEAAGAEFFVRKDGKEVPVQFVHKFPKL